MLIDNNIDDDRGQNMKGQARTEKYNKERYIISFPTTLHHQHK